jgi:hypothetical protein
MPYHHIDVECQQVSKKPGDPCGDVFLCKRTIYHSTLICADGIGSGVKAHIASQMNTARLSQLLSSGMSLRDAFFSVVETMGQWRDGTKPFTAFTVARVLNDGSTTILSYEMPAPFFLGPQEAHVLPAHPLVIETGVAHEYRCHLDPGTGLLLMSDGVVQSGMGYAYPLGWGLQGVEEFLQGWVGRGRPLRLVVRDILRQAQDHDQGTNGDDQTVVVAHCREGGVVNMMTGPAKDRAEDMDRVNAFLDLEGLKVVCGASTADVVARCAQEELEVEQKPMSFSTPPRYFIKGIDLETEGAVTLNQVYYILGEDLERETDQSAAADLALMLKGADRINFTVGCAQNPANKDLVYRKQGILARDKIIPLMAAKLEQMGKLVSVQYI